MIFENLESVIIKGKGETQKGEKGKKRKGGGQKNKGLTHGW